MVKGLIQLAENLERHPNQEKVERASIFLQSALLKILEITNKNKGPEYEQITHIIRDYEYKL